MIHRGKDRRFNRRCGNPLFGDDIGNDFGVAGRVENRAVHFQFPAQLGGVGQVAVVRKRHTAFDVVDHHRLRVLGRVAAGGAVTDVTDGHLPVAERFERVFFKHVVDESRAFVAMNHAVVVDGDAAAFLPAVLERKQRVIGAGGNVSGFVAVNAEHAAFFMNTVEHSFPLCFRIKSAFYARPKRLNTSL